MPWCIGSPQHRQTGRLLVRTASIAADTDNPLAICSSILSALRSSHALRLCVLQYLAPDVGLSHTTQVGVVVWVQERHHPVIGFSSTTSLPQLGHHSTRAFAPRLSSARNGSVDSSHECSEIDPLQPFHLYYHRSLELYANQTYASLAYKAGYQGLHDHGDQSFPESTKYL